MNPKIEVIESKLRGGKDLDEFRIKRRNPYGSYTILYTQ
jgi:hypothetical protein